MAFLDSEVNLEENKKGFRFSFFFIHFSLNFYSFLFIFSYEITQLSLWHSTHALNRSWNNRQASTTSETDGSSKV